MEWVNFDLASDDEEQHNDVQPEPACSSSGVPRQNPVVISPEEGDTTESSSDEEENSEENLPLVDQALLRYYTPPDLELESDSSDVGDLTSEDGHGECGMKHDRNCTFCLCPLMQPPRDAMNTRSSSSVSTMSSSPPHSEGDDMDEYLGRYYADMDLDEERDFDVLDDVVETKITFKLDTNNPAMDSQAAASDREDM